MGLRSALSEAPHSNSHMALGPAAPRTVTPLATEPARGTVSGQADVTGQAEGLEYQ